MHEIKVTQVGTYDITQTIQLTDEQWADSVNPVTGKLYDVGVVYEETFNQAEAGGMCAQCSGWGRKFSRSLSDEVEVIHVKNVNGKIIYDQDSKE